MEVRKVKISPEVLSEEISQQIYSGITVGYYSGMSYVLSSGTVDLGTYVIGDATIDGGIIGDFGALNNSTTILQISRKNLLGYDWSLYFQEQIIEGSFITISSTTATIEFKSQQDGVINDFYLEFGLVALARATEGVFSVGEEVNVSTRRVGTSQLVNLSIPILLNQNYEDIGYYSPFDGDLSQLNEEVNFTFVVNPVNNYEICVFNTSNRTKTYLSDTTYYVNWGDTDVVEQVTVFIPDSFCHTYALFPDTQYTISFTGTSSFGEFIIKKNLIVPFDNDVIDNPYGEVSFIPFNGSWIGTPSTQDYITNYDSENVAIVVAPFTVTGYTNSRINELAVVGANKFIIDLPIQLADGTEGVLNSISDEFTGYTINDQVYQDYPDGTSIFICVSEGLTDIMVSTSGITKFEYLMNIIEQPIIQNSVFIERGKNSALENFRRIGEVTSTGGLVRYGYSYFDVRNYNDV
jgi:hypothetical protein